MTMIGGDLGAMSALSSRFSTAGANFQTQTTGIARGVDTALEEFTSQMRTLDSEARGLAEEINAEMTRLNSKAAATTWTGANRIKMDGIVASLDDEIVAIRTAIDNFATEASAVVNGALTSTMTGLRTNVDTTGTNATTISDNFSTSVESQRAAFDQVMNG